MSTFFSLLRARTGVDFSLYKHSTLRRRILRRMLLHKINTLPAYLNYLRIHLVEVDALFNDLLINVTGFFRDPQVFQALKRRIFPKLLQGPPKRLAVAHLGLRLFHGRGSLLHGDQPWWSFLKPLHTHVNAQIFATDISEASLEKARARAFIRRTSRWTFRPSGCAGFFVKTNGTLPGEQSHPGHVRLRAAKLIVDPPFSNLDLISCRNVLIYLGPVLQKKIMPVFHYALKPEGLSAAGLLGSHRHRVGPFFTLLDKKQQDLQKKAACLSPGPPGLAQENAGELETARRRQGPAASPSPKRRICNSMWTV